MIFRSNQHFQRSRQETDLSFWFLMLKPICMSEPNTVLIYFAMVDPTTTLCSFKGFWTQLKRTVKQKVVWEQLIFKNFIKFLWQDSQGNTTYLFFSRPSPKYAIAYGYDTSIYVYHVVRCMFLSLNFHYSLFVIVF